MSDKLYLGTAAMYEDKKHGTYNVNIELIYAHCREEAFEILKRKYPSSFSMTIKEPLSRYSHLSEEEATAQEVYEPDIVKNGIVVARFIRYLNPGECDCVYDNDPQHFTDGRKVYRKVQKHI